MGHGRTGHEGGENRQAAQYAAEKGNHVCCRIRDYECNTLSAC